ncbi:MBL fold metallo-hydrolase [Aquincola sp. S2]|uniref:MBL fold metallo-hydrolase n=1 Tax=Pseudaquabacterium terrae TaxID=2732868 RepID=A0ABX2EL91_9BURK|nr:MBL fold metallo-hydrolase [Aquabacterium terrae]NRF69294.1 MBL fold metallo-hydrolase [Aquabacterium terrae]
MKSLGSRAQGARLERMRASPRWDGAGFRNLHPVLPGLRDSAAPRPTLGDFLCGGEGRVPPGPLPLLDPRAAWTHAPATGLRATWIGHSTALLEIDGHRVLTDPVWGPRASPSRLAGPKRFQPAAVPLKALPALDAVLISHDHYDHLDYPTIQALVKLPVPFITSLGVGAHLQGWGVPPERITELDWWDSHALPGTGLIITAAPSQHFSGRGLKDRNATLWSGLAVRGPRHAVFFSGDTGLTEEYAAIRERLGPFDLALLEIGAFHPSWGDIHLGPANALQALALLGNPPLLPIHWATFNLALHAWDQPVETLLQLAPAQGAALVMPRLGEAVEPARVDGVVPWWRAVHAPAPGRRRVPPPAADQAPPKAMPWPLD